MYNGDMQKFQMPHFKYRRQIGLMAYVTWLMMASILMFVPPAFIQNVVWPESYLPFFIVLLLGCFWSFWAATGRWKRSMLWSLIFTAGVGLRVNQLDSWFNLLLLFGFGVIWEYYWHETKKAETV